MKYYVSAQGREFEVEVDGDRVTIDGRAYRASLAQVPGTPLRQVRLDDRTYVLPVAPAGRGRWLLSPRGQRWEVEVLDARARHIRRLTGAGQARSGPRVLKAPMPGLVVRVVVEPGQAVPAGGGLVVLEAMKMENELKAAAPGVIEAVLVEPGTAVEKGQVLVRFADPDQP